MKCGKQNDDDAIFCAYCGQKKIVARQTNSNDKRHIIKEERRTEPQIVSFNASQTSESDSSSTNKTEQTVTKHSDIKRISTRKVFWILVIAVIAVSLTIGFTILYKISFPSSDQSPTNQLSATEDNSNENTPLTSSENKKDSSLDALTQIINGHLAALEGIYCRNNGACLTIDDNGIMELTDTNGSPINTSLFHIGDYPFSPYLKHSTISVSDKEYNHVAYLGAVADTASCVSGTLNEDGWSCNAPDGSFMTLSVAFFYVPQGVDVSDVENEAHVTIDSGNPDSNKPYLVFQKEAGTNAPFDASDDAVFYLVR